MKIRNIKLDELIPYEKNPRINDKAVKYVAESIKEFGFKVPIVIDKNNVIVAGHTRYKASIELGLTEVPCIVADDLTEEQIKAFRLADNKVGEIAEWDFELLAEELQGIDDLDMEAFGFEMPKNLTSSVRSTSIFNSLSLLFTIANIGLSIFNSFAKSINLIIIKSPLSLI